MPSAFPLPSRLRRRPGSFRRHWRHWRGGRALVAGITAFTLAACGGSAGDRPVRVTIPPGATFAAAAESLQSAGVVRSARLFGLYAKATGRDRALKAGTYELRRGATWSSTVDALTSGKTLMAVATVPEGYALTAIVPLLARTLQVPVDSVEAAVRDTALLRRLDVPSGTLEGYLFPATYHWPLGTSAREAVGSMVAEFERRWKPEWNGRLQALAMSRHDVVTLASIVEKEARLAEERPVIAAVYLNRLRVGMPLQADPTVQYSLGQHVGRVLYRHLEVDSPYNTYRHKGLPPGPIASPGTPSLAAALYPASVPYLYFVAHPDGHHEFRRTFAEHTRARDELRRARGASGSAAASPPRGGK